MDDRFLHALRREPRPEFQHALAERLHAGDERAEARRPRRLVPAFAATFAAIVVALLFSMPSVRASAQALLDLFRVQNFAAVSIPPERVERLNAQSGDLKALIGDHVEALQEPGEPRTYPTVEAAARAVDFRVSTVAQAPNGLPLESVAVRGEGRARLTINAARLKALMETFDIRDLEVPQSIDGAQVTVHMNPAVIQRWKSERRHVELIQGRSPEISLPAGVDLARLGEIGLRIAGLEPDEARRFARSFDWHGTLLVPVPANASSFREVTVHGARGLLITTMAPPAKGRQHRDGAVVLWTEGDRVFGLAGDLGPQDLMQMAESIQ